jgi:hypothetical protein
MDQIFFALLAISIGVWINYTFFWKKGYMGFNKNDDK